jgi:predicted nucleic acid-binding protein
VILVVDASVTLKWLLADPENEAGTQRATQLMHAVVSGEVEIFQPLHWLAEVGAVLARLSPGSAADDVVMLRAMELPQTDEPAVLRRACELAIDLKQHVFDTLYHAVALTTDGATLVTADERYLRAARRLGSVMSLNQWQM